eukprot:TRINITY_DN30734_c0_g1_i1.p1 TRINITY_DN30734_c0_g1~~TRINITY_DN30734_c0_g1_i1.p1  ORF type:complete len:454 (+),score=41.67 TRINITY_DN30734_c0_g1_i1:127-1488(+)
MPLVPKSSVRTSADTVISQPRVLVVGAGCTGALTAALLRRRCGDKLSISIWEWGRGPAGRMSSFWSMVGNGQKALADMGAQCISLRRVERLPTWLLPLLSPAEPTGLGNTTERRSSGNGMNWFHFHAKDGLPALQHASLAEARPEDLRFESRLVELVSVSVNGRPAWRAGYAPKGRKATGSEHFDLVIFAGTARDAEGLDALRSALSHTQQRAVAGVSYDHRLCLGLILRPELGVRLEALCEGKAEMTFDDQSDNCLSLVARQEVKGRACGNLSCVVVLHSTPKFAAQNLQAAKRANVHPSEMGTQALIDCLAGLLSMSSRELQSAIIERKTVHWRQCQVRKPCSADARNGNCMVAGAAPNLILAGDYLVSPETTGSFEGCLDSAEAAAAAAQRLLFGSACHTSHESAAGASGTVVVGLENTSSGDATKSTTTRARRWQRKSETSADAGSVAT